MDKRIKVGKLVSNEALCSGYPEELARVVERAEKFTAKYKDLDHLRERIEDGTIEIEPVDEVNSDLKPFGYTHMTEWLIGDAYFVQVLEDAE